MSGFKRLGHFPSKGSPHKMSRTVMVTGPGEELDLDGDVTAAPLHFDSMPAINRLFGTDRPMGTRLSPTSSAALRVNTGRPASPLLLRGYQSKLAAESVDGRNVVVVAPTGSGKTLVAAHVILHHLKEKGKAAKAVFLVPTGPLVSQQLAEVEAYFRGQCETDWSLGAVEGGNSKQSKALTLRGLHVTVATPQCLVNMMKNSEPMERLDIHEISLLVFDECHHCDQDHPYMKVMTEYLDAKHNSDVKVKLPQILGLSASLGVGGADTEAAALRHVQSICARMDATHLASLSGDDLKDAAAEGRDQVELVRNVDRAHDHFFIVVSRAMAKIEDEALKQLAPLSGQIMAEMDNAAAFPPALMPSDRESQAYEAWICHYLNFLPPLKPRSEEATAAKRLALLCIEHLRIYRNGLELSAHVTSRQGLAYLEKETESRDGKLRLINDKVLTPGEDRLFGTAKKLIRELRDQGEQESRLVRRLLDEVSGQLCAVPDSRILVFAKTRDLVKALKDFFSARVATAKLCPQVLTSVNTANSDGGQTDTEQKEILLRFNDGRCKMLLATTVAEEGLDIARCNLVVKYNHVTNEIALVQKRGRGRAKGSRSLLLTSSSKIAAKERENVAKEELMNRVINSIGAGQYLAQFAKEVEHIQAELVEKRRADLAFKERMRPNRNRKFILRCKTCEKVVCHSDGLRKIDCHYVVADPELWTRVTISPSMPLSFYTLAICGSLFCTECPKADIGQVIYSGETFYPALKKDRLTMEDVDPRAEPPLPKRRVLIRKWKQTEPFFQVLDLNESDRLAMRAALRRVDPDMESTLRQIQITTSNK